MPGLRNDFDTTVKYSALAPWTLNYVKHINSIFAYNRFTQQGEKVMKLNGQQIKILVRCPKSRRGNSFVINSSRFQLSKAGEGTQKILYEIWLAKTQIFQTREAAELWRCRMKNETGHE